MIEAKWKYTYPPYGLCRPTLSRPSSLQTQETLQDVTHSPTASSASSSRGTGAHLPPQGGTPPQIVNVIKIVCWKKKNLCVEIFRSLWASTGGCGVVFAWALVLFRCLQIHSMIEELQMQKIDRWNNIKQARRWQTMMGFILFYMCFFLSILNRRQLPHLRHASLLTNINYSSLWCRLLSLQFAHVRANKS